MPEHKTNSKAKDKVLCPSGANEKNKILIVVLIVCFVILILFFLYTLSREPECYLIEQDKSCGIGYYPKYSCFYDLKLTQCCKGNDYLLKGVYGDLNCWWILSGQNEALLNKVIE